jgi:hypothetical protein
MVYQISTPGEIEAMPEEDHRDETQLKAKMFMRERLEKNTHQLDLMGYLTYQGSEPSALDPGCRSASGSIPDTKSGLCLMEYHVPCV